MKIIKDVKEPQDIIIYGGYVNEVVVDRSFQIKIDDDYTGIDLFMDGKEIHSFESDGFANVLTVDQLIDKRLFESEHIDAYEDADFVVLENFTGQITVRAFDSEGVETDNFEIDGYLEHQNEVDSYYIEVPTGTKFRTFQYDDIESEIKKYRIPIQRNYKIDQVNS